MTQDNHRRSLTLKHSLKKNFPRIINGSNAFTLPELLIATTIVLLTSVTILFSYIQCLEINDINQTTVLALQGGRNMMETIKATSFAAVHDTYNNQTFLIPELNGIGLIEIDNKNPELLGVKVKCFWKQGKGRLIGEDINLNGLLDKDEDTNDNLELDSPLTLFTYLYQQ